MLETRSLFTKLSLTPHFGSVSIVTFGSELATGLCLALEGSTVELVFTAVAALFLSITLTIRRSSSSASGYDSAPAGSDLTVVALAFSAFPPAVCLSLLQIFEAVALVIPGSDLTVVGVASLADLLID
jgi:hypothetical protein